MTRPEVAALHRALEDQGYYVTPIGDAVKVHERGEEGPILHLAPLVEAVLAAQWRPGPCVLFDIDGTLSDCRHRRHHLAGPRPNWAAFLDAMGDDPPNEPIVALAKLLSRTTTIVLLSGRNERHRRVTELWLTLHGVPFSALYLRADGDSRADHIAKRDLLARVRADGYEPLLVADDRPSVVAMWRAEGLTCLQCAADAEFEE